MFLGKKGKANESAGEEEMDPTEEVMSSEPKAADVFATMPKG